MKIQSSAPQDLNLYTHGKKQSGQPVLQSGTYPTLSHDTDSIEISTTARKLAASDVTHHAPVYFGNAQIHESLSRLLQDQPDEVKDAVYGLISSNLNTETAGNEDQAALLELGLAQGKYIADNFMKGNNATELMNTLRQIADLSQARATHPQTGKAQAANIPQRPVGAPEDYVDLTYMMKTYEPETLAKLEEAITNGKDWASILINFAKKVPTQKGWVQPQQTATTQSMESIESIMSANRFGKTATTSLTVFIEDIQSVLTKGNFTNTDLLTNNLYSFIRTLESLS
ncbi:hypothetical protein [Paenibacillus sanguinis]|uniref:hypothetical protein n=1 Tax=Paenibacillus sanguinis TaxID=225906 RepID=UPI00036731BD|nr:hypothetical protein [Paenibacillus sanguinis]